MFSFGWSEIALIVIIVVIVVGPKEIPNLLKVIGTFTRSIKKISREFKSSFDELSKDDELKSFKNSIKEIKDIKDDIDPTKEIKKNVDEIKKTTDIFKDEINHLNKKDQKKN